MTLYDEPMLYDLLVSSSEPWETFYAEQARRQGGPLLELACGTGRLAVPLTRHGFDVTGLDLSPAMLDRARRKARAAGAGVRFFQADMRDFALPRRFAMIFVAINSLLHLTSIDDFRACFACVRRHLAPGGAFLFDIFNPNVRLLGRDAAERVPFGRFTIAGRGEIGVEESTEYDAATQVMRTRWHLSDAGWLEAGAIEPLELRYVFPQELLLLLEAGGLRLESRWGDLARAPFRSGSPHQVCLCRTAQGSGPELFPASRQGSNQCEPRSA